MTVKESNEQLNQRLDDLLTYFERFQDEYRNDQERQSKTNEIVIKNETNIKNIWKLPVVISVLVTLMSGAGWILSVITGG